jgi:leader peptidase (prepilin peptidase) / N-methyltransferase
MIVLEQTIAVLIFGLIIGSFLTACIYRIPYGRPEGLDDLDEEEDEKEPPPPEVTLLNPRRSICPNCKKQLRWYHNVPVFSWIFLWGKCAFCKAPISAKYPFVELLTAVFALLSYRMYGLTPTAFVVFAFCASLIVITFIDLKYYIIPDVISIPGSLIAIAIGVSNDYWNFFSDPISRGSVDTLLGVLAGGGFLFLVAEFYIHVRHKTGLGFGDVKLLTLVGALFGPAGALYTIFVGSLLGSVLGLLQILFRGNKLSTPIPFGPYLAGASVLYIFLGLGPLYQLHLLLIEWLQGGL